MMPSNLSVLHTEDEILIAFETANILADLGFGTMRVAHTLRSAEKLDLAERFDVALVDMNLGSGELITEIGMSLKSAARMWCSRPAKTSGNSARVFRDFIFLKSLFRRGISSALADTLAAKMSAWIKT